MTMAFAAVRSLLATGSHTCGVTDWRQMECYHYGTQGSKLDFLG